MARELKFRAWDKLSNRYIMAEDSQPIKIDLYGNVIYDDSWCSSDVEIEQFTGLRDKNGKEIYEGDIIQEYVGGTIWGNSYPVEWVSGECCNFSCTGFNIDDYSKKEVIGNIHENKELLND